MRVETANRVCRQGPEERDTCKGFDLSAHLDSRGRNERASGGTGAVESSLRLFSGVILFVYAATHFINHALGIRSIDAMDAGARYLREPWQTPLGGVVLYGAFLIHMGLGLRAILRRRHLRIPATEAWQLTLGLLIPVLLIPHAGTIRLGQLLFDTDVGYRGALHLMWVASPMVAMPRQVALLLILWVHGCIGLRSRIRHERWYTTYAAPLASVAILIPALALIGFTNAGFELREALAADPALGARLETPLHDTHHAEHAAVVTRTVAILLWSYIGLVAGILGIRLMRNVLELKVRGIRIAYPGGRVITVPQGFSVLEASRWAGFPHESICGGRGRCSTCRIRVVSAAADLPAPNAQERMTLEGIGAPADIRLACQLRPTADVTVAPLVAPRMRANKATQFDAAVADGIEIDVTAMFVDMRESTRLASGVLPYDALFIFDRYIQCVTSAIHDHGGRITSIAGDGIMSVFGEGDDPAGATRAAFHAARDLWEQTDALSGELMGDLQTPLKLGIGIHAGLSVLASRGAGAGLQFLGNTGNLAAKLEACSKMLDCTLVASDTALARLGDMQAAPDLVTVPIGGYDQPMQVAAFRDSLELRRLLSS